MLKCLDCGKTFKAQHWADKHAEKLGHHFKSSKAAVVDTEDDVEETPRSVLEALDSVTDQIEAISIEFDNLTDRVAQLRQMVLGK